MADIFKGSIKITEKITVNYMISRFGEDLLIALSGGEEHIGAVSVYTPHQVKSWRRPGHKEYVLTEKLKEILSPLFPNRAVVILAGIHYDHLDNKDIDLIIEKTAEWAAAIPEEIKTERE
jgi:hypothetical protein